MYTFEVHEPVHLLFSFSTVKCSVMYEYFIFFVLGGFIQVIRRVLAKTVGAEGNFAAEWYFYPRIGSKLLDFPESLEY